MAAASVQMKSVCGSNFASRMVESEVVSARKGTGPLLHGEIGWVVPTVLQSTAYGHCGMAYGTPFADC